MSSPLSSSPYNSRNLDYPKYSFVAFKPGTPLQASELNEIQENVLMQLTNTNKFLYDIVAGDTYSTTSFLGTFNFPVLTTLNEITLNLNGSDLIMNIGSSWINVPINQQYRVWSKPSNVSLTLPTTGGIVYSSYESSFIFCSNDSDDEGYIFNDNSGGTDSSCGADRIKVSSSITLNSASAVQLFTIQSITDSEEYLITDKLNRTRRITL